MPAGMMSGRQRTVGNAMGRDPRDAIERMQPRNLPPGLLRDDSPYTTRRQAPTFRLAQMDPADRARLQDMYEQATRAGRNLPQEMDAAEMRRLFGPGGPPRGVYPQYGLRRRGFGPDERLRLMQFDSYPLAFKRQLRQNPQMRRNLRATGALGMRRLDPAKLARQPNAPPYPGMGDPLVAQMRAQDMRDPVNQLRAYQQKVDSGLWTPEQAAAFVDRRRGMSGGVSPPAGSIGGAVGYGGYRSGTGSPSLNR